MKKFTIIGGVNGTGKSSLSGVLRRQLQDMGMIIDPDMIAAKEKCGRIEAGKVAAKTAEECLQKGVNFSQETTLSGHRTLRIIRKAGELGYHIRLFYVGVNTAEESLVRIENRVRKGGHSIPSEDVQRRFEKRFADLDDILPYCDEVHLYDNENGFREAAVFQSGELIMVTDDVPGWLKDFSQFRQNRMKAR